MSPVKSQERGAQEPEAKVSACAHGHCLVDGKVCDMPTKHSWEADRPLVHAGVHWRCGPQLQGTSTACKNMAPVPRGFAV